MRHKDEAVGGGGGGEETCSRKPRFKGDAGTLWGQLLSLDNAVTLSAKFSERSAHTLTLDWANESDLCDGHIQFLTILTPRA